VTQIYRVNSQDIMHETIDGEVVIVNLETGAYYAIDGSGEYIWDRLSTDGASQQQLIDELALRFDAPAEELRAAVGGFIGQLLDEVLIMPAQDAVTSSANVHPATSRSGFVAPHLHKYTDMEALLLADPIHEVAADGWPSVNTQ
jgi:hypothetical protein